METYSSEHPSCTTEEAPLCQNFGIKCWHCSLEGTLFWKPKDEKTRHHSFWDRKREKEEAKRAQGKGRMGGRGNKEKSLKQVLARKSEKRVKKTLNKKFDQNRFDEIFQETLCSGRIRGDGDIGNHCSLIDVKSTTRSTSWITEKSDLEKAQAQAHSHRKQYGIIVNENNQGEAIALMSLEDMTHLFQYLAYLEDKLQEKED